MDGDGVAVERASPERVPEALEAVFREYHEWNRAAIVEALRDTELTREDIEAGYVIDAIIEDDLGRLRDPSSGSMLFLARVNGAIAGCVILDPLPADVGEVKRLYVDPDYRGHGLGRRLLEALVDAATETGYERVRLSTGPHHTAAHAIYDDLGFEPIPPYECEVPESVHDHWYFRELDLAGSPAGT